MGRHINIPIFIPHLGCPNQCVFCNQKTISGVSKFDPESVKEIIERTLETIESDAEVELAFFGGSFTGIDRDLMIDLLKTANQYIISGRIKCIRCSTRPDYIDNEILAILKYYGVKNIELGLQSICDDVLTITKRGHNSDCAFYACKMITEAGFDLTGQMMIGLPGSTLEKEIKTAKFIISSGCKYARIYPTVVFHETELCDMSRAGIYDPLELNDAVVRSAEVLKVLLDGGIRVIRIGLCASDNLISDDTYFAGPNHPALGELVENELYYRLIFDEAIKLNLTAHSILRISVRRGAVSKAVGQRKRNKLLLQHNLGIKDVRFEENANLSDYEFILRVENGENKCI